MDQAACLRLSGLQAPAKKPLATHVSKNMKSNYLEMLPQRKPDAALPAPERTPGIEKHLASIPRQVEARNLRRVGPVTEGIAFGESRGGGPVVDSVRVPEPGQ
jgi:hypothetical protein